MDVVNFHVYGLLWPRFFHFRFVPLTLGEFPICIYGDCPKLCPFGGRAPLPACPAVRFHSDRTSGDCYMPGLLLPSQVLPPDRDSFPEFQGHHT